MKIVLLTTCVADPVRLKYLERMLHSVVRAEFGLRSRHQLEMHLLIQKTQTGTLPVEIPEFTTVQTIPGMISISAARNLLLEPLLREGRLGTDTLVAYPDDDCWYPRGILETIADRFAANDKLDLFFCRYGSQPADMHGVDFNRTKPAKMRHTVINISSNTMFLRGSVMAKVEHFDESLGVGTANGGSEDLDVGLAAYCHARDREFLDRVIIGHRDKDRHMRARYYRSGLMVLARYARRGAALQVARKLAVGVALCLRGEMTLAGFASAIRAMAHKPSETVG